MHAIRRATAAAFCALATSLAVAQQAASPSDLRKLPASPAKHEQAWSPTVLPPAKAAEKLPQSPTGWSKQEIELAQARCTALLKGLDVVALPGEPIREGSECGTPAPMRLVSVGSNPEIAFSPPPTLNCDMIAALHKWLVGDVQPMARKHLGTPVVGVATMSSYSCRNAYGRAKGRLSEHGRVNALDIAGFMTAGGQTSLVLADWGPIAREVAAQAIAAQKQREAAEAAKREQSSPAHDALPSVATHLLRPSISVSVPGMVVPSRSPDAPSALGLTTQPSRLGGPKEGGTARLASPPQALSNKAQFLRAIHRAACNIFGTVLGPEANKAHKNHFHVDMAERRHGSICE